MAEMGHTDPGLALRIYAQAMRRDEADQDALRALVEGSQLAVVPNRCPTRRLVAKPPRTPKPARGAGFGESG